MYVLFPFKKRNSIFLIEIGALILNNIIILGWLSQWEISEDLIVTNVFVLLEIYSLVSFSRNRLFKFCNA